MRYLPFLAIWAGVIFLNIGTGARADEDFGEDGGDYVPGVTAEPDLQYLPQNYVPGLYEAAISAELISEAISTPEPSVAAAPTGTDELPFALLDAAVDGDQDGLPDEDEERVGTDAANADSDGDGYIDGIEVVRGYNPLIASPDDKLSFSLQEEELAERSGEGVFKVTSVRIGGVGLLTEGLITIGGTGPAHSLVRIFVFSEDVHVFVARTDGGGRFLYSTEDVFEMGAHVAYAAGVDAAGVPADVSIPFRFQKTAEGIAQPAVFVQPTASEIPAVRTQADNGSEADLPLALLLAAITIGVGVVIVLALLIWRLYLRRTIQT